MTPRHRRYAMRSTSMLALIATMPPMSRDTHRKVLIGAFMWLGSDRWAYP